MRVRMAVMTAVPPRTAKMTATRHPNDARHPGPQYALGRARSRSVAPIPRKCLVVFGQDENSPLALALPVLVPRRWP